MAAVAEDGPVTSVSSVSTANHVWILPGLTDLQTANCLVFSFDLIILADDSGDFTA